MPRHAIRDLAAFSLTPWSSVPDGRVFVDRGTPQVKSKVNGHPLLVTLTKRSGVDGPVFQDAKFYSAPGRSVLMLAAELRITATPSGDGVALVDDLNLFGCLIALPEGTGVCGNFADDKSGVHEPGRVAINLQTGACEFHDSEAPWAWKSWTIDWKNAHDEVVFSLLSGEETP